jgi:hypothetical protein
MPVLLGIRGFYLGICVLFLCLSCWHRLFVAAHQLLLSLVYLACFAVVLATPYFNNYWNWPLVFDLNVLLAVFFMVFHDIRGFRFAFAVTCAVLVFLAFVAVMQTSISSDFLYITASLLCVTNISATYTKERLLKLRFSLIRKLGEETVKTNALLEEILPKRFLQQLKSGTLTYLLASQLLRFVSHCSFSCYSDPNKCVIEDIPEATLLYTDLVEFTKLAKRLQPRDLFTYLNELYGAFDELLHQERFGCVTKIDTIGACPCL